MWALMLLFIIILLTTTASAQYSVVGKTNYGLVGGITTTTHNIFLGVPYALPPTGSNRWQLPQPPLPWTGIFNATVKGFVCPQVGAPRASSEDCLNLNIYSPINSTNKNLPVYIFIHGGGFMEGNGGDFNGEFLSGSDIIYVSINYRLGTFGYYAPAILANSSSATGFFGIQDQRWAFQWVHDNIEAFGGNPNMVTIGGQSAGAISICVHLATPRSAGLFQHAIMESGFCTIFTQLEAIQTSTIIETNLNCTGVSVLECMYNKTVDEIMAAGLNHDYYPSLNPYEITQQPITLFQEGQFNKVELIIGTNHDELAFIACPLFGTINATQYPETLSKLYGASWGPLILQVYPVANYNPPVGGITAALTDSTFKCPTQEAAAAISLNQILGVYMYEFNHVPSWQTNKCYNVSHSTELFFMYPFNPTFEGYNPSEVALAGNMRDWWVSFISTGIPQSSNSVPWTRFTNSTQSYLAIDVVQSVMQPHFEQPFCTFWDTRKN